MMTKKKVTVKKSKVYVNVREVNWVLLLIMSIIFGWIGGLGLWWIIDIILVATKYNFQNVEYVE